MLETLLKKLYLILNKNGVIILDYFNPQIRLLNGRIENVHCYDFSINDKTISVFENHSYNELEQIA
jgi:hypothetical protein